MVYRIFVEKKQGLTHEADALFSEARHILGIEKLDRVRLLNRYDVEHIDATLFDYAKNTVFAEPQVDSVTESFDADGATVFAVEYLPGQFDQRADSAAQCVALLSCAERPLVRTAKVYLLYGDLAENDIEKIKQYCINPVESREATLDLPKTLDIAYAKPAMVKKLDGFTRLDDAGLLHILETYRLAMDMDDLRVCRDYFLSENRDPSITELRMIDTYWSDHCRHTTFGTLFGKVVFGDAETEKTYQDYLAERKKLGREEKPLCLMDLATCAIRSLKAQGKLTKLDESEEINACTVKMMVTRQGKEEEWLLLFKNETHNHPTEIEPFGGAATCIGGAIRDPLSGRAYVYGAMRVTGASDPTLPIAETMAGKLPQRKIVTTAAQGYSSYGNQIGLATGQVEEIYHPGYMAKHMEIGAVIGAAPAKNVRREVPKDGDIVILLGGRTGRDGCGGATGSSKSHTTDSLTESGAEVQKGNAPEERKLQRLFRNPEATKLIKRCNDFGAGGVSVAIGELADGVCINLDAVPKKYEGLDGTELAISESQERMAVVVSPEDAERFCALADTENLEATIVAKVTESPRLMMFWREEKIVDLSRAFLNENGAKKVMDIETTKPENYDRKVGDDFASAMQDMASDLNVASKRGLAERFDATIGAGTVLFPFGGKNLLTPIGAMVHKVSVEDGECDTASYMSFGYNPYISEKSPYHGAFLAVIESLTKLISAGSPLSDCYFTFQEYFEKLQADPKRWGKPLSALLGAFKAQKELGIASIGGKDSMSGSFDTLDVPPTLVSFAVGIGNASRATSPEFKQAGNRVLWLRPTVDANGLPNSASVLALLARVEEGIGNGQILSASSVGFGGVAEMVMKATFGNGIGFTYRDGFSLNALFGYQYGSVLIEVTDAFVGCDEEHLGDTTVAENIVYGATSMPLWDLYRVWEKPLAKVYPTQSKAQEAKVIEAISYNATATTEATQATINKPTKQASSAVLHGAPKILVPVFPGTNCEYDVARVMHKAGAKADIFVVNNKNAEGITASVEAFAKAIATSQGIFIPGGFSGGDEPDGSGKFITAFFRNPAIKEATHTLLKARDGLICGICNGFQALVKLGLVPYGEIRDTLETDPTLTFNSIARHQSQMVQTRIASNKSPWLMHTEVGEVYTVPISHGEGRFLASEATLSEMIKNGQIATQYVTPNGTPTSDIRYNPNHSALAIEGITSPDGRVFGKMGHSERIGGNLYRNVPGNYDMRLFEAFVDYYS